MEKKIAWNDFQNATQQELKKVYKMNDRQLERQLRDHLCGADANQRRKAYENFYSRRK